MIRVNVDREFLKRHGSTKTTNRKRDVGYIYFT